MMVRPNSTSIVYALYCVIHMTQHYLCSEKDGSGFIHNLKKTPGTFLYGVFFSDPLLPRKGFLILVEHLVSYEVFWPSFSNDHHSLFRNNDCPKTTGRYCTLTALFREIV